jgi:cell division protein FtsN
MAARRGKKQARRNGGSAGTPGWVWLFVGLLIGGVVAVTVYLKMPRASDNGLPHPNASAQPPKSSNTGVAPEGGAPDTTATAAQKTKFDFYTLLPEKEVVIPDEELSARVKAEAAAQAASKAQAALPTTSANTPSGTAPTTGSSPTAIQPNSGTDTTNGSTVNAASGTNTTTAATNTNTSATGTTAQSGRYLLQAGAFRNGAEADNLKARIALLGLVGRVEIVETPNGPMHRVRIGPYATASELEQAKQKLGSGGLPAVAIRVK